MSVKANGRAKQRMRPVRSGWAASCYPESAWEGQGDRWEWVKERWWDISQLIIFIWIHDKIYPLNMINCIDCVQAPDKQKCFFFHFCQKSSLSHLPSYSYLAKRHIRYVFFELFIDEWWVCMLCRSFLFGWNSDGPVVQIEVHIGQKLFQDLPVASMVGQVLIELGSDGPDLPEVPPGCVGEVVVLQVVPQIEVEDIPETDVVIGLLTFDELVVLCDDVNGCRVGSDGGESGNEEEEECPWAPEVVDGIIGEGNEEVVHGLFLVHAGVLHEDGTQGVEELDHQVEDIFVPSEFGGHFGFPGEGQIRVSVDFSQEVVVVGVVPSEGDSRGECHGDVAERSHDLVDGKILVPSEMDKIVDTAMQRVVKQSSYQVCVKEEYPYILVLNGEGVTLAQYPLASMTSMTATAMMMVQGLSGISSWATCGYLVSIIFLRSRCDSSPFTQVKSCFTPLL